MAFPKTAKLRWSKMRWEHLGGWKRTKVGPESEADAKIRGPWSAHFTLRPVGKKSWEVLVEEFEKDVLINEYSIRSATERSAKAMAQFEIDFLRSF